MGSRWAITGNAWIMAVLVGGGCLRCGAAQTSDAAAQEHFQSASRLYLAGQFPKAIDELNLSLRLAPNQPKAARLLGISYELMGRLFEADQALGNAAKLDPGDADTWFFLGRVCYLENFFGRARKTLGEALRLDPDHVRAREYLALTLEVDGDPDRAIEQYRDALERAARLKKPSWSLHVEYGALLHRMNRTGESEKQLIAGRDANPDHWRAHFELGKLYFEAGKYDLAARELTASLGTGAVEGKDTAAICHVLARVYYALGRDQDALNALALAEKSKP